MRIDWLHPSQGEAYWAAMRFLSSRIWGREIALSPGTALTVTHGNSLRAVCLFHEWDKDAATIEITAASSGPWMTKTVIAEMADFAFGQLGCQAVILRTGTENRKVCRMASSAGFKRYDVPRLRGRDSAGVFFILGDDEWRNHRLNVRATHGQQTPSPDAAA